jgi:hypothetical protein
METTVTNHGLERRVVKNIQFHARHLARDNAVPGMDVQDYEQDLAADLLHRRPAFDPLVASFATFADRIVRHRVSALKTPTVRSNAERKTTSLDASIISFDGDEHTLLDVLPDSASLTEEAVVLGIDMRRFLPKLTEVEWQTCAVLLDDNISEGARAAAITRSKAYDHIDHLRGHAAAHGLGDYFEERPDSLAAPPVNGMASSVTSQIGDSQVRVPPMTIAFKPASPRLFVTDAYLCRWISQAAAGQTLEYFRGFLVVDRDSNGSRLRAEDQQELCLVADRARAAADSGFVHLLQRRYGTHDYGYLIVARPRALLPAGDDR